MYKNHPKKYTYGRPQPCVRVLKVKPTWTDCRIDQMTTINLDSGYGFYTLRSMAWIRDLGGLCKVGALLRVGVGVVCVGSEDCFYFYFLKKIIYDQGLIYSFN